MATDVTEQQILEELKKIHFPGYTRDIVSFGLVKKVTVCGGVVKVEIGLVSSNPAIPKKIEKDVKEVLSQLAGVTQINVQMQVTPAERVAPSGASGPPKPDPNLLPHVKHVIAVASGKGGVGKSTVAVNLALALKETGAKVGLMDADVYGPSIPMMMGIEQKPEAEEGKIVPLEQFGIKLMSIGFLVGEESPLIWRGPIVSRVVQQFLRDVLWGELDYLVVDLPPGTGDIQLTLVQTVPISGAVIVTTPQEVALLDVVKANEMFKTVHTPILGVVENMSTFVCPKCTHEEPIFRQGGGAKEAQRIGVPLLAQIPIEPAICVGGDTGKPIFIQSPSSQAKEAFKTLVHNLIHQLSMLTPSSQSK